MLLEPVVSCWRWARLSQAYLCSSKTLKNGESRQQKILDFAASFSVEICKKKKWHRVIYSHDKIVKRTSTKTQSVVGTLFAFAQVASFVLNAVSECFKPGI